MRFNYVLYGLATASFVASAYFFLTTAQILFVGSTAAVGLVLVAGGFFLKPKQTTSIPQPASAPTTQTDLKQTPTVQAEPVAAQAPIQPVKEQTLAIQTAAVTEIQAVPQTPVSIATVASVEPPPQIGASELTNIRGINEKRVVQLNTIGIATMDDLANASSSELAVKLGISERIVKMWIGTAKKTPK